MKKEELHFPQVVATVTQSADLDFLSTGQSPCCDILEYRLDNLLEDKDRVPARLDASSVPALITVRRPDEGGANDLTDSARIEIYRDFLSRSSLIDVEIASFESESAFLELATEAKEAGVLVISSFHDFTGYPGREKLCAVIERGYQSGADVVKLAMVIETMSELFELTEVVEEQAAKGRLISAMGMGSLGKISRLVLARAGSCLNYGYLQTENAPGQWSAKDLKALIEETAPLK